MVVNVIYRSASVSSSGLPVLYTCPFSGTCQGGIASTGITCREGSSGVLCAICDDGWLQTSKGCSRCGSSESIALLVGLILIIIIIIFLVIVAILKRKRMTISLTVLAIGVSFVQILGVVDVEYDVPW
jgi:hypothetical protein